MPNKQPMN